MKLTTASCLLATATSAIAMIVVDDPGHPQFPQAQLLGGAALALPMLNEPAVEERQVPGQTLQQAATPPPTQYPSITSYGFQSNIDVAPFSTYVTAFYTQTFAAVPDQWPSPGVGKIGYGTSENKRDTMPEVTPAPVAIAAIEEDVYSFVLELETVYITQSLRRVTEVVVCETRTVLGHMAWNSTVAHRTASGPATGHVTGAVGSPSRTASGSLGPGSSGRSASTSGAITATSV